MQQIFHTEFPQTQNFSEGHATLRRTHSSILLPFTVSDYCWKLSIIICLPSHCTRKLQLKNKRFFGPLNSCFIREGAIYKTIRYPTARLICFIAVQFIVGVDVSVLKKAVFILSKATLRLNVCSPHLHSVNLKCLWKQHRQMWLWLNTHYLSNKLTKRVT
jgi:hypothetical protein